MPAHTHFGVGSAQAADVGSPTNAVLLGIINNVYGPPTNLVAMSPGEIGNVGGSQAHLNMQPFLTLSFCIALQGIFPSPN